RQLVKPAMEEGKIVICDRFVDSSIAYQGFGRQLGSVVEEINKHAIDGHMPDLTFLLRLEPEGGQKRIADRELDRIELQSADFHERTFAGYEAVAANNPERVAVVNARDTIDNIHQVILNRVKELPGLEDL
ncbi:MAG: dTMP kinase, partial [Eubacterium sp.]|nr:dTMP kinase [Candidatus Colimonas fimequi]